MGNILGFAFALLLYGVIYKISASSAPEQRIYLFMILPALLGYTLLPFGSGIREKIYYKFYEMGNNGFYIPSPGEEEEVAGGPSAPEEINVENK
jgi:hypothetical protein